MWPIDCIEYKRDGKVLTKEEITRFIDDYTAGRIADYQAAAWLMAVYFQGMTYEEIAAALDINVGTIKSRISRGRMKLREELRTIPELFGESRV